MSESILFRLSHGRLRVLEETVEAWKAEHAQTMLAHDVEDIVQECLEVPKSLARMWSSVFDKIAANEIDDLHKTGEALQVVFDGWLRFFGSFRDWARGWAERSRHPIAGLAALDRTVEQLERLKQNVLEHWPWFDQKAIAEGWAEHRQGECLDVDEIIHELQNRNP